MCEFCGVDHPDLEDLTIYDIMGMMDESWAIFFLGAHLLHEKAITTNEKNMANEVLAHVESLANIFADFIKTVKSDALEIEFFGKN
jgi:hypothetical protein